MIRKCTKKNQGFFPFFKVESLFLIILIFFYKSLTCCFLALAGVRSRNVNTICMAAAIFIVGTLTRFTIHFYFL